MSTAPAALLIVLMAVLVVTGDYSLKLASLDSDALRNRWFVIGCVLYLLSAVGWVFALRHLKLATVGVVYALSTVLFLTLLGVALGESLNRYEVAGIILAAVSIELLLRFTG
jgi:drug/metabolite transporter (DMT)-like permease